MSRDLIKKILREVTRSDNGNAGGYEPPFTPGFRKFKKPQLKPFDIPITSHNDPESHYNQMSDKRITTSESEWIDVDKIPLNEDLGVWFGTKKKPKGGSQPKGPWVNICKKVDGKHPPCGRPDTSKGGYPKCRAAGVAGKMTDSQKKSACQQKRNAEKKDTQSGKGQKPIMTSYKPKK
jgi:hypothetical protein